jgi:hypothetical protein
MRGVEAEAVDQFALANCDVKCTAQIICSCLFDILLRLRYKYIHKQSIRCSEWVSTVFKKNLNCFIYFKYKIINTFLNHLFTKSSTRLLFFIEFCIQVFNSFSISFVRQF